MSFLRACAAWRTRRFLYSIRISSSGAFLTAWFESTLHNRVPCMRRLSGFAARQARNDIPELLYAFDAAIEGACAALEWGNAGEGRMELDFADAAPRSAKGDYQAMGLTGEPIRGRWERRRTGNAIEGQANEWAGLRMGRPKGGRPTDRPCVPRPRCIGRGSQRLRKLAGGRPRRCETDMEGGRNTAIPTWTWRPAGGWRGLRTRRNTDGGPTCGEIGP